MIGAFSGRPEGFVCVVLLTRQCPYIGLRVLDSGPSSIDMNLHEPGHRGARRHRRADTLEHRGEKVGGGFFWNWV